MNVSTAREQQRKFRNRVLKAWLKKNKLWKQCWRWSKLRSVPWRSDRPDETVSCCFCGGQACADGHNGARVGRGWGWGCADWWLQLSQRRGTQADSWSPVAPDMTVIEARGIVFHCGGHSAAQSSGHCSSQWRKQAVELQRTRPEN